MKQIHYFFTLLFTCVALCIAGSVSAQTFTVVDNFETHQWHSPGYGDGNNWTTTSAIYSTDWKTEGANSIKLSNNSYTYKWTAYQTSCMDTENPTTIKFDVKNWSSVPQTITIKVVDVGGTERTIGSKVLAANTVYSGATCASFTNTYSFRIFRIVQETYGANLVTASIDNIRFTTGGVESLWDPCEPHLFWTGTLDASNPDYSVNLAGDITHAKKSPNFSSTASLAMQWNSTTSTANTAEIKAVNLNLNYTNEWYFRFDVYRPSTTGNVNIMVFLWDDSIGAGTINTTVPANQWTTVTLPLFNANKLGKITEIHLVAQLTDKYKTGELYFDNLQVGGFKPLTTPGALANPHIIKDYNDGYKGQNNFYGIATQNGKDGGTISTSVVTDGYNSSKALKVNYNLSAANSYIYYSNTLRMNTAKKDLVMYLKAGVTGNPGRVRLELKSATTGGKAYCFLSGITTAWKQWRVPVSTSNLIAEGNFDPAKITEVVISLDNNSVNNNAKIGAFYMDDMSFDDLNANAPTGYPGIDFAEGSIITLPNHAHVVKDYNNGLAEGNNFYGVTLYSTKNGATMLPKPTVVAGGQSGNALRVNYSVTDTNRFVMYTNTLKQNSVKNQIALYLKAEAAATNPGRVKLEMHDNTWKSTSGGGAYCYLEGITTSWKQWIVDINLVNMATIFGTFDPANITEIVLVVEGNNANDQAKTGVFLVDDITFVDATNVITSFPFLTFPQATSTDVRQIGVPYLLDDYDGRVLNAAGEVKNLGLNEYFGYVGVVTGGSTYLKNSLATGTISSTEKGGIARSKPYSQKITYSFHNDSVNEFVSFYNTLAPWGIPDGVRPKDYQHFDSIRDFSGFDKFSIWARAVTGGNPGTLRIEFHDNTWGKTNSFKTGKATATLVNLTATWQQYLVSLKPGDLEVIGSFDLSKTKEIVISFDYPLAKDKSGTVYIDDLQFVDTDQKFVTTADFQSDAFLNLVERRTFQYFLDAVDPKTGLVLDRVHFLDLATISATGFGLTAWCVGVERGWISRQKGEELVIKVLTNLWNTPQGTATSGTSGYKGFYYHFLEASTGLRKVPMDAYRQPVELSIIDASLLFTGVLTAREYFSSNATIKALADNIYNRADWAWFLDKTGTRATNPNYNKFYAGWKPESGFMTNFHWDYYTDEVMMMCLLGIGSPTHPVNKDVFNEWARVTKTYNGHNVTQSMFGTMFTYFFANIWYDFYGKADAQGKDWWANSVQAGLANRDYCIAGKDGRGHNSLVYNANSWGVSSCEAVPAGIDTIYIGANGARPNIALDIDGVAQGETDGTVPPYGGISMIGFSSKQGGMPINYITDMMKNYYQNTQLWGGWYGFRDSYTDTSDINTLNYGTAVHGAPLGSITPISKFPMYKSAYFSINQGPIMLMIENYRTNLVRNMFMSNPRVQFAMDQVFTNTVAVAPEAKDVTIKVGSENAITGYSPQPGDSLVGTFTYYDLNNNPQSGSTYRWLISTAYDGPYTAITGATLLKYKVLPTDIDKYIRFEVTPKNSTAPTTGLAVQSFPARIVMGVTTSQYTMIDNFEIHNWHHYGLYGDAGSVTYSTEWKTQGTSSLKISNTATGNNWSMATSGCFETETPTAIKMDIYSGNCPRIEVKVRTSANIEEQLGFLNMTANTQYLNQSFPLNGKNMRTLELVQGWYNAALTHMYVDNIRVTIGGVDYPLGSL